MLSFDERKILLNFTKDSNKNSKKQPSQRFSFKVNFLKYKL